MEIKNNQIYTILKELDIINDESLSFYSNSVRDGDGLSVYRCEKSGVIFLSETNHIQIEYYENLDEKEYWGGKNRREIILTTKEDDERRFNQFKKIILNKKWLDFGTGSGGILDLLSPFARKTHAVEPQNSIRKILRKDGYEVFKSTEDIDDGYEVVTMFHVLEHLLDPINDLKKVLNKMSVGGKIIIEVPHANDFLLSFLENKNFKNFTFWSEHLILHTRFSLLKFLETAGFRNINIQGYQRYPLSNHLYWLSEGKPNGHNVWSILRDENLDREYLNLLMKLDKTDTLIAFAEK